MLVVLDVSRFSSAGYASSDIGHVACSFWNITAAMRYNTFRLDFAFTKCFVKFDMSEDSTDPNNPHVFCSCY